MQCSLLITDRIDGKVRVPMPSQIRNELFDFLIKNYVVDEFRGIIKYNGVNISTRARFISSIRRYFLYFYPLRDNINTGGVYYETLRKETVNFVKDFISKSKMNFCGIYFKPLDFGLQNIDISNWDFVLFYDNKSEHIKIKEFFLDKDRKKQIINDIFNSKKVKNKDIYIIYFEKEDQIENTVINSRIQNLKSFLNKFVTSNVYIKSSKESIIIEEINKSKTLKDSFLFFISHPADAPEIYDRIKLFLIENKVPSQFIKLERLDSQKIWVLKNNLTLEIIKKNLENGIELKPLSNEIGGFICLSDLYNISERLFGISITKISESNYNDEIEIFSDIRYRVNENSDLIELDESNISKIVDKLDAYTEVKNITIDIHFTRRVDENSLRKLAELLKSKNINVRKMFYISNMSTRFVFDRYGISSEYVCNYSIIDSKIGLIDVSGRVITHGNIFPLYVELLYPSKELTKEDLENIVWTVKKRTYRIDNFPALKLPETIKFFRSAKNSFCSRITGKLTFESPFII